MKRNRDRVRKDEARRIASQLHLDDEPLQVDLDEDERMEIASLSSDLDNKAFTKVEHANSAGHKHFEVFLVVTLLVKMIARSAGTGPQDSTSTIDLSDKFAA